ncbi:MAG TPA: hypothetical protein VNY73_00470 [Bacteroidia bacterium]|nr:hypothetical protein [Bacteroidia bacterium]
MAQKYTLEITQVVNGSTPNEEQVWLKAKEAINIKGFALIDRTFDEKDKVSNEFRHIFVFPEFELTKDQIVVVRTGTGTNGFRKFSDVDEKYLALYWGAKECVWNDKGGDTATLISFVPVNFVKVPAVQKKKA